MTLPVATTSLLGVRPDEPLPALLARLEAVHPWRPFDPRAVEFVGSVSRRLIKHPAVRRFPELAALSHWFRPAALQELARAQPALDATTLQLGRGLAFHLAPANVDSVSMYSWLLSLLAGNSNLVRVSQKASEQLEVLLDVLRDATAHDAGGVTERVAVLTYPHDAGITSAISQRCHLRVVWGGDATVAAIRAIALRPTALELCFPDRFSAAAMDARAVLLCDEQPLRQLAHGFCNDALWFGQQACSSPRLVAWIGDDATSRAARARFWPAIEAEVRRREAENTPAMTMDRVGAAFRLAAAGLGHLPQGEPVSAFPLRVILDGPLVREVADVHCGNGLFVERDYRALSELASELTDREQTLAVFGLSRPDLEDFVLSLAPRAVDRIVPVGKALDFSPTWDGVDLVTAFSRRVSLPAGTARIAP